MLFTNTDYYKCLSEEDKLLSKKVLDWIDLADNKYIKKFSAFLDERQCEVCKSVLSFMKYDNYSFYGGYENASRKILGIFPPYCDVLFSDFPVKPVLFSYRAVDNLSHRDFLGLLMSLQIRRDMIGDILVNNDKCLVFVNETVYEFILNNVNKIGSVGVKTSTDIESFNFDIENNFKVIRGTVSSLRIDCIVSLVTKLSREKSAALIKSLGVKVNYIDVKNPSELLKKDDIFSVRGYGKFIFKAITGISKKNRYCVEIYKYI